MPLGQDVAARWSRARRLAAYHKRPGVAEIDKNGKMPCHIRVLVPAVRLCSGPGHVTGSDNGNMKAKEDRLLTST